VATKPSPADRRNPIAPRKWSAFAEYNYLSFSNTSVTLVPPAGGAIPINFNHNVQTLLVGLNYRFGGP